MYSRPFVYRFVHFSVFKTLEVFEKKKKKTKNKQTNKEILEIDLTLNPFLKRHVLYSSKLKELADDNFQFGKNGRKFSKTVKNTVGKGEIARYEQFLLFPQCFQNICNTDM